MASTLSYYIHPYAQQIALHALQRINGARLKFILQYKEPPEEIQVGETGPEKSDSTVVLRVRSPNVWMRICSCFDLVRHHLTFRCKDLVTHEFRDLRKPICSKKSTVMTSVEYLTCAYPHPSFYPDGLTVNRSTSRTKAALDREIYCFNFSPEWHGSSNPPTASRKPGKTSHPTTTPPTSSSAPSSHRI